MAMANIHQPLCQMAVVSTFKIPSSMIFAKKYGNRSVPKDWTSIKRNKLKKKRRSSL